MIAYFEEGNFSFIRKENKKINNKNCVNAEVWLMVAISWPSRTSSWAKLKLLKIRKLVQLYTHATLTLPYLSDVPVHTQSHFELHWIGAIEQPAVQPKN